MTYNLALDSGGTKVQAILYDETFHPVKTARVGSMRPNTTPMELVTMHAGQLIDGLGIRGASLACVCGIYEDLFLKMLQKACTVHAFHRDSEAAVGFSAADVHGDGALMVAGTGATAFVRRNEQEFSAGGYGNLVADEGSGYWIGKEGMMAAVRDYENRGPKTILTDLIGCDMGGNRETFRERLFQHVYGRQDASPAGYVASCCKLVSKAAAAGDETAKDILMRAGKLLCDQVVSALNKHGVQGDAPIALMGSVWRSEGTLLEAFNESLRKTNMNYRVHRPLFEPIVGAVINHHQRLHGGFSAWDRGVFIREFGDFLYEKR